MTTASTVLAVAVAAPEATAHESSPGDVYFKNSMFMVGNFSGCPGESASSAVRSAQLFLWASGSWGAPGIMNAGKVDGTWDADMSDAVWLFQKRHGIETDRCMGVDTWDQVRLDLRYQTYEPGWPNTKRYLYEESQLDSWYPGSPVPEIRLIKEDYADACFWFAYTAQWRTFNQGSLPDSSCWNHYIDESTGGIDHIGWSQLPNSWAAN